MKIIATAKELIDKGWWEKYCEETGINPWCVNEGRIPSDEIIEWEMEANNEKT